MAQVVVVLPTSEGWLVRAPTLPDDLAFSSGAQAEACARRLGEDLARGGEAAEILVHLRGGALAGRIVVNPLGS